MWYLSEELVGLALFGNNFSMETKNHMVKAIFNHEGDDERLKRPSLDLEHIIDKTLVDFITNNSMLSFIKLDLSHDFLSQPASQ